MPNIDFSLELPQISPEAIEQFRSVTKDMDEQILNLARGMISASQENTLLLQDFSNEFQKRCNFLSEEINSFSNEWILLLEYIQSDITSFNQLLSSIEILDDYVAFPKNLIIDDIDEITSRDSSKTTSSTISTTKLSPLQSLKEFELLITIILFILAPFWEHFVSNYLNSLDAPESEPVVIQDSSLTNTPITEDQIQQLCDNLIQLTEYQQSIIDLLENQQEELPKTDSPLPDTQPQFATPDSASDPMTGSFD